MIRLRSTRSSAKDSTIARMQSPSHTLHRNEHLFSFKQDHLLAAKSLQQNTPKRSSAAEVCHLIQRPSCRACVRPQLPMDEVLIFSPQDWSHDCLTFLDPTELKFFLQITPILGRTIEEAQAKHGKWRKCIDWEGGLAKLSSFVNFDFSRLPPDEPFIFDDINSDNSIHTMLKTIKRYDKDGTLTPRKLGEQMAFCGFAPIPVGTPEMVADLMEKWVNEADIDGFNVACKFSLPHFLQSILSISVRCFKP